MPHRPRSGSHLPATRISTERSTTRRSSPIRSRSVALLRADGQPDEVIAAGLLHDVLEKTGTHSRGASAPVRSPRCRARRVGLRRPIDRRLRLAEARAARSRSARPAPTRSRSSPRTRSPKSESSRCCQPRALTKPRPAPSSPITGRASRCSAELPGTAPSSIFLTPSSTRARCTLRSRGLALMAQLQASRARSGASRELAQSDASATCQPS